MTVAVLFVADSCWWPLNISNSLSLLPPPVYALRYAGAAGWTLTAADEGRLPCELEASSSSNNTARNSGLCPKMYSVPRGLRFHIRRAVARVLGFAPASHPYPASSRIQCAVIGWVRRSPWLASDPGAAGRPSVRTTAPGETRREQRPRRRAGPDAGVTAPVLTRSSRHLHTYIQPLLPLGEAPPRCRPTRATRVGSGRSVAMVEWFRSQDMEFVSIIVNEVRCGTTARCTPSAHMVCTTLRSPPPEVPPCQYLPAICFKYPRWNACERRG